MVPTTRSSRTPRSAAAHQDSNTAYDFIASDSENGEASTDPSTSTTKRPRKSTTGINKDKVYRKTSPKPQQEQLKFPARRKTVRAKKTSTTDEEPTRQSLAASSSSGSGKKGNARNKKATDKRQSTLTQINWIPSTFPEDENESYLKEGDRKPPVVTLTGKTSDDDDGEWGGLRRAGTKTATEKKLGKQSAAENKKTTNRGRKRRKTTGDLGLELELAKHTEDDDDDGAVPSSRYYTQTLTQMPSWRPSDEGADDGGLLRMIGSISGGGTEDDGFNFEDVPHLAEEEDEYEATRPSKKRKRPSPSPSKPNNPTEVFPSSIQPQTQRVPSVIPQTPSKQRSGSTEIPSSQPSPFTPNLEIAARNWSPLAQGIDRTPLKERSTNVDAPTPSESVIRRKMSRSEIPDSWSSANGGMSPLAPLPSSSQGWRSRVGRTPLKEISFVNVDVNVGDVSLELGESRGAELDSPSVGPFGNSGSLSQRSQRLDDEVIMDSDEEFQGFPDDDDEPEAPGSPSPLRPSSRLVPQPSLVEEVIAEVVASDNEEAVASIMETPEGEDADARGSADLGSMIQRPSSLWQPQAASAEQRLDEGTEPDKEETVAPTSRTLAHESPLYRFSAGILGAGVTALEGLAPSLREAVTQPSSSTSRTGKPLTQQSSPQPTSKRSSTPEPPVEEVDTDLETPRPARRRPSSSSAIERETPISSPQKTSPAVAPVSQLGYSYKSQAFESQRVAFEIIRQMAPQTDRSDVIVSIHPEYVKHITDGTKTHEFRNFRLFGTVRRMWIYITSPVQELKYMAIISGYKLPGEIAAEDPGIGNVAFNEGKSTKYAYELKQVYQLNNPVSLGRMQENGWVEQAPQKFKYVPPAVLGELMGNLRCALFEEHEHEHGIGEGSSRQSQHSMTESQELKEQLRSDIAATQKRAQLSSSPRGPRQHQVEGTDEDDAVTEPSSQDAEVGGSEHVTATPPQPTFLTNSTRPVVFAKPPAPPSRSQRSVIHVEDSPPMVRFTQLHSQHIVKSTVRPSQATTASLSSQSQQLPPFPSTQHYTPTRGGGPMPGIDSSGLPSLTEDVLVVDDSPGPIRASCDGGSGGRGREDDGTNNSNNTNSHTQSSLGLGMLLGSSQGPGLAGFGGEHDSLMDDSRIRIPPGEGEIVWDSDGEVE